MIKYRGFYYILDSRDKTKKTALNFIGKNFKKEYDSIGELEKEIIQSNIKNMIGYTIERITIENIINKEVK